MLSERITKVLTFLQAEIPTEDIAKSPVVKHPAQFQQDHP